MLNLMSAMLLLVGTVVYRRYVLDALSFFNFIFCPVTNEDWLASPFDDDVLAFGDGSEIDLDFGLGEHVGGGRHVD